MDDHVLLLSLYMAAVCVFMLQPVILDALPAAPEPESASYVADLGWRMTQNWHDAMLSNHLLYDMLATAVYLPCSVLLYTRTAYLVMYKMEMGLALTVIVLCGATLVGSATWLPVPAERLVLEDASLTYFFSPVPTVPNSLVQPRLGLALVMLHELFVSRNQVSCGRYLVQNGFLALYIHTVVFYILATRQTYTATVLVSLFAAKTLLDLSRRLCQDRETRLRRRFGVDVPASAGHTPHTGHSPRFSLSEGEELDDETVELNTEVKSRTMRLVEQARRQAGLDEGSTV